MDKKENPHNDHRERMRSKYLRLGADAFEEHELLEMLLYHSIAQKNTNPMAHNLIYSCGSLDKVLHAKIDTLTETDGIGKACAMQLSLTGSISRRATIEAAAENAFDSSFRQMHYLFNWYKGKPAGTVAALLLDHRKRLIETITLSAGRMFRPESYCNSITESASRLEASYIILSHSHENGVRTPSVEDIYLTGSIRSALKIINVQLLEHYIVTDTDCIACSSTAPASGR